MGKSSSNAAQQQALYNQQVENNKRVYQEQQAEIAQQRQALEDEERARKEDEQRRRNELRQNRLGSRNVAAASTDEATIQRAILG